MCGYKAKYLQYIKFLLLAFVYNLGHIGVKSGELQES